MAIRKTVQAGNPVIRAKAQKVKLPLDKTSQRVVADLIDTMRETGLVGIAAPQIGKGVRIFVTEVRKTKYRKRAPIPLQIFINPEIIKTSKKQVSDWEGCGSIANSNLFAKVVRPEKITVRAFDQNGEKFELETSGLLARIIQHENDHLNGVLFTDKADLSTIMSRDEYLKMRKLESRKK
jgi:peptide deformylase